MKWRWLYFSISLMFLLPGIFSIIFYGLKPSIDFTGGTLIEISVPAGVELSSESVQEMVGDRMEVAQVQTSGANQFIIKGNEISNEVGQELIEVIAENVGSVERLRFERVGAVISNELVKKTFVGIALVAGAITLYVSRQFSELRFGVSAILAMLHDTLILVGIFSLLGHFYQVQVDILFVTAVLTTLSFSIHDTIVVYDRIRELRQKHPREKFEDLINQSVTDTLTRSLNNSITIIIMLLTLYLMGGESIRYFSLALLIGAITGTYSSTFTAAPLLLFWEKKKN